MTDIAAIANGLSDEARFVIVALDDDWQAGPELSEDVCDRLLSLRDTGLLDREFADWSKETTLKSGAIHVAMAACWWFRLTPLGLAVKRHLEQERG